MTGTCSTMLTDERIFEIARSLRWQTQYAEIRSNALDLSRAIERVAIEAYQRQQWRPIETAPRDGRTLILLLTPSRIPQSAWSNTWWISGFSVECKPTHWMPMPPLPDAP